jgi:hypothetical protein
MTTTSLDKLRVVAQQQGWAVQERSANRPAQVIRLTSDNTDLVIDALLWPIGRYGFKASLSRRTERGTTRSLDIILDHWKEVEDVLKDPSVVIA